MGRPIMRFLLILKICSALTTSPFLGSVGQLGLTSWDRSDTPVLEYRKRVAQRGPGLALFSSSDMILKGKVDRMCQRSSAIIALIACNVYCENNPDCELQMVQGKADMKGEMKMMTQVQYCADNFDREHAMCMSEMGY